MTIKRTLAFATLGLFIFSGFLSMAQGAELQGLLSTSPVTAGGIGGQPAPNALCPENSVVVGISTTASAFGTPTPDLGFYCRALNDQGQLSEPSSIANSVYVPIHGSGNSQIWCPESQIAVGIQAVASKVVSGAGLICATPPALSTKVETPVIGSGTQIDLVCPASHVLVGANIRISTGVERLGGYCSTFKTYRVSYSLNGGTGKVPGSKILKLGEGLIVESGQDVARQGFEFAGWSDGVKTYRAGDRYFPQAAQSTLAAIWKILPPGRPDRPELVREVGQVTVLVSRPASGGVPSYYLVTSDDGKTCTIRSPEDSCEIGGLDGGKSYSFSVIAGNESGESEPSEAARTDVVNSPSPPTKLSYTLIEDGIRVQWQPPRSDGGSPVLNYLVSAVAGGEVVGTCSALAPATECQILGLKPNSKFEIAVIAVNRVGESEPSILDDQGVVKRVQESTPVAFKQKPYVPSDDPAGTLDVLVVGFALLVMAGAASSIASEHERREQKELSEVVFGHLLAIERGARWGDASHTWRKIPFGREVENYLNKLSSVLGRFTLVLSRTVVDGSYFRAMFGAGYVFLPVLGAAFGLIAADSVGREVAPPPLTWLVLILALATLDALSGLVAALFFAIFSALSAETFAFSDFLLLVGLSAVMFAPSLIASNIRPLRRYLQNDSDVWERVGDYAFGALISGWAVSKMIKALPALAEHSLEISSQARTIGLYVFGFILVRLTLEELVLWGYPKRLLEATARQPEEWKYYEISTPGIKTLVFVFLASPFIGNRWELWVGGVLFLLAEVMPSIEKKLPNIKAVQQYLPKGTFKTMVMIFVGAAASKMVQTSIDSPEKQITLGFILLALPGLFFKFLAALADASHDHKTWRGTTGGLLVYRIGGVIVFVALALQAWGYNLAGLLF